MYREACFSRKYVYKSRPAKRSSPERVDSDNPLILADRRFTTDISEQVGNFQATAHKIELRSVVVVFPKC